MTGTILQVSASRGGLPKFAVPEGFVSALGIDGDAVRHPKFHGGPQKALLIACAGAIRELTAMGFPLFPGAMGENLTVDGLNHRQMRLGQRYRAGGVLLELTALRTPCNALDVYGAGIKEAVFDNAAREGDPSSPRWGLSGFYAAVIEPGLVRPGDRIAQVD